MFLNELLNVKISENMSLFLSLSLPNKLLIKIGSSEISNPI